MKEQTDNILYEVWALGYHMNTQRSEVMWMTPNERKFWLDELIKQRDKENEEMKKSMK